MTWNTSVITEPVLKYETKEYAQIYLWNKDAGSHFPDEAPEAGQSYAIVLSSRCSGSLSPHQALTHN